MSGADHWALLGIDPTDDRREIKSAYAARLKCIDVDRDPAAFIALREAMETALTWGTATPYWEEEDWYDEFDAAADEAGPEGETVIEQIEMAGDQDYEQWRPALPAEGDTALDSACVELDRLLFGEGEADPGRVALLGKALLADPELENVDRLTGVEQWLIQAIAAAPPRSDPLIEMAAARFGWDRARGHWRRDYQLETILQRRRDLKFLSRCRNDHHHHARALKELGGPPRSALGWRELGLAAEVSAFLEAVDRDHPSLHHDMNEATLDWWRSYFHGRHLPVQFWPLMIIGTIALSLTAAIVLTAQERNPLLALLLIPLAAMIVFGTLSFVSELQTLLRERAERRWTDAAATRQNPWFLFAGLLLPLVAAPAPDTPLIAWTFSAFAILLLAAASWSAWTHPRDFWLFPRTSFLPALTGILTVQMAVILSGPENARLLPALFAMAWTAYLGADVAQERIQEMNRGRRLGIILLSLLLALAAAAWLTIEASPWPPAALTLVLVPIAIVSVHLATAASPVDVHGIEWPLRLVSLFFYFSSVMFVVQFGQGLFLTICAYGLAYVTVRASSALKAELAGKAAPAGGLE